MAEIDVDYIDDSAGSGSSAGMAPSGWRAAVADVLTVLRVVLTLAVMGVIIVGWQGLGEGDAATYERMLAASVLAAVLFGAAALTDVLDDAVGGAEMAGFRKLGWFDDLADTLLVDGTLLALVVATLAAGTAGLGLLLPVGVILGRDVLVALVKGRQLRRLGWPQTRWGTAKNALAMFATLALVSSPWLTGVVNRVRPGDVMDIYGSPSSLVWNAGLIGLWVTAVLSVVTGVMLLLGTRARQDLDHTRGEAV